MKKKLTYRDKLIELAKIYGVREVQDYIKNKKNLTSGQLELILRKNKIIIPKDFNTNFFKENFSKPLFRASKRIVDLKEELKDAKTNDDRDETVKKIMDVLDTKIRPAVARDGGDIKFKSFKEGVVKVELQGSCSGCPSSLMTLKQGVQNLLKHYVKEVNSVEAD